MDLAADVTIAPWQPTDVEALFDAAVRSHERLWPWMPWCHAGYVIEEARTWIATQIVAFQVGDAFSFAICSRDGNLLGGCGLNGLDRPNRRANLGYWIRSGATRQGAATAAVRLLLRWAHQHTQLDRLEILAAVENVASQRVAEKAGAVREGVLRRRILLHDRSHDAVVYSFVRD